MRLTVGTATWVHISSVKSTLFSLNTQILFNVSKSFRYFEGPSERSYHHLSRSFHSGRKFISKYYIDESSNAVNLNNTTPLLLKTLKISNDIKSSDCRRLGQPGSKDLPWDVSWQNNKVSLAFWRYLFWELNKLHLLSRSYNPLRRRENPFTLNSLCQIYFILQDQIWELSFIFTCDAARL